MSQNPEFLRQAQVFLLVQWVVSNVVGWALGLLLIVGIDSETPSYVRFGIVAFMLGVGHGDKAQIRMMVNMLLPKASYDSDDAADGLAIAICHAHHRGAAALEKRLVTG